MPFIGYDVFGNLVRATDEIGRVTLDGYDKLGRLTSSAHPGGVLGTQYLTLGT